MESWAVRCCLTAAQHEGPIAAEVLRLRSHVGQIERTAHRPCYDERQFIDHLVGNSDASNGILRSELQCGGLHFDFGRGAYDLESDAGTYSVPFVQDQPGNHGRT